MNQPSVTQKKLSNTSELLVVRTLRVRTTLQLIEITEL